MASCDGCHKIVGTIEDPGCWILVPVDLSRRHVVCSRCFENLSGKQPMIEDYVFDVRLLTMRDRVAVSLGLKYNEEVE